MERERDGLAIERLHSSTGGAVTVNNGQAVLDDTASFGGIVTRDRGAGMSQQPGSFAAKGAPRPAGCAF